MKNLIYIPIFLALRFIGIAQDTNGIESDTKVYGTQTLFTDGEFDKFQIKEEFLDSLNAVRKRNKFPILKYNYELEGLVKLRTKTIIEHIDQIEDGLYNSNYTKFIHYKSIRDYKYYFNNTSFLDSTPMIIHEGNLSIPSYYKAKDIILYSIKSMQDNKKAWNEFYDRKYTHVTFDFRKGARRIVVSVIFSKRKTRSDGKK